MYITFIYNILKMDLKNSIIKETENKNINFFINRSDVEGVCDIDINIFPTHFLVIILIY